MREARAEGGDWFGGYSSISERRDETLTKKMVINTEKMGWSKGR